jgi:hypothetical protein
VSNFHSHNQEQHRRSVQCEQRWRRYTLTNSLANLCSFVICKRIPCTSALGKCLNFYTSFELFVSRMFIVEVMKNLLYVDDGHQVFCFILFRHVCPEENGASTVLPF